MRSSIVLAIIASLAVMLSFVPVLVRSHGYTLVPAARAYLCTSAVGENTGCGTVMYEPQSLEAVDGFPNGGPSDGNIASAGHDAFGELNEQSSSRWAKRPIKAGDQVFRWKFTVNHITKGFSYFITKQNWNPNTRLTRDDFESTPFCTLDYGNKQPPFVFEHSCNVPSRTGYQIILSIWNVGDTDKSFFDVADVMFPSDATPPKWNWVGSILASRDLKVGDIVRTRVYDDSANSLSDLKTELKITRTSDGSRNAWPKLLAAKINADQDVLRAGHKNSDTSFSPQAGRNEIYAAVSSKVKRVETEFVIKTTPPVVTPTDPEDTPDTDDYVWVFPKQISLYTAGTRVLQPKNNKVYVCKPFPASGYCMQYSANNPQFEPGYGSNWQMAWTLL